MKDGESFNQETTLCGKSILKNIQTAKEKRIFYRSTLCRCRFSRYCKEESKRKGIERWTWDSRERYRKKICRDI